MLNQNQLKTTNKLKCFTYTVWTISIIISSKKVVLLEEIKNKSIKIEKIMSTDSIWVQIQYKWVQIIAYF